MVSIQHALRTAIGAGSAIALVIVSAGGLRAQAIEAGQPAFVVDSTVDAVDAAPGDGVCATVDGDCTLRAAIQETNALPGGDTIELPAGEYVLTLGGAGENAAASGDLDLIEDVVIAGAGVDVSFVDGDRSDRIFEVAVGADVTISGLTVRGGFSGMSGGGLENQGSLALHDVSVTDNFTNSFGGGIINRGHLTITNATVASNSAGASSGGVSNTSEGVVEIGDSTISGNTATISAGGLGSDGTMTVTNVVVQGNESDMAGGIGNNGTLTVVGSTIAENDAMSDSGGIGNSAGAFAEVLDSTIRGNTSATFAGIGNGGTFNLRDSVVEDNVSTVVGGGISNGGPMTIEGSTISGNESEVAAGIVNGIAGDLEIVNSTISGNSGMSSAALLSLGPSSVEHTTIADNEVTSGGVIHYSGMLSFDHTLIGENTGANCSGNGTLVSDGYNMEDEDSCGLSATGDQTGAEPRVGPLADNGGPTRTHALLPGSVAIDNGRASCAPPVDDQRGVARPQGAACDIGAFELEGGATKPFGDANDDGFVNSIDAALILQFGAGLLPELHQPSYADVNGDGTEDSIDASLVLQFGAGLISRLPPL